MLRGIQHNMYSRTSVDKLLNAIDCSNILKDGKTEANHNQQEKFKKVTWFCKWRTELLILSLGGTSCIINLLNTEMHSEKNNAELYQKSRKSTKTF